MPIHTEQVKDSLSISLKRKHKGLTTHYFVFSNSARNLGAMVSPLTLNGQPVLEKNYTTRVLEKKNFKPMGTFTDQEDLKSGNGNMIKQGRT